MMQSEENLVNDSLEWTTVKLRWFILIVVSFINISGRYVSFLNCKFFRLI